MKELDHRGDISSSSTLIHQVGSNEDYDKNSNNIESIPVGKNNSTPLRRRDKGNNNNETRLSLIF